VKQPSNGKSSVLYMLLLTSVALHVLIPKAGIKIGEVPVTIADVSFALLLWPALAAARKPEPGGSLRITRKFLLLGMLYFIVRALEMGLTAENLARITALCIYPLVFFLFVRNIRSQQQTSAVVRLVGLCLLGVVLYGSAQYLLGTDTVQVRGLTANWSDASDPDFLSQKDNVIDEGGKLKLTSTYQNGNLLGVNLLLLLPVASFAWDKKLKSLALAASVVVIGLTASRSAWAGAIFLLVLWLPSVRMDWKKRVGLAVLLGGCAFLFLVHSPLASLRLEGSGENSLSTWGGRAVGAWIIWEDSLNSSVPSILFGVHPQESYAYEMLYPSIYETFGLVGLLIWVVPLLVSLGAFYRHRDHPLARAAFTGISAWLFVAVAEGAFWLPPTSFNVWTVLGLGWCAVLTRTRVAESGALPERPVRGFQVFAT